MRTERLVEMANDIGEFFVVESDEEKAIEGIAAHLRRFWDPRMRQAILKHLAEGGEGLQDRVRQAVGRLEQRSAA